MTQQPPEDRRPAWEGGTYFPPPSNLRQPQTSQQQPVFNTQYPAPGQFVNQQYPSGEYPLAPSQGQYANPQFPLGQYPPTPQQMPSQGYPQQMPQGYSQQPNYQQVPPQISQGYPQQPSQQTLQGYPQQQNYQQVPQPFVTQPSAMPKKKAWYKRPWGIVLIVFLSLGGVEE